jgi:hypothetical protein
MLRDVSVSVLAVSPDGQWILVTTPSASQLCGHGSDGVACGYTTLSITNPAPSSAACGVAHPRLLTSPVVQNVTLTCPPFCPFAVGALLPFAADPSESSYVLASMPASPNALPLAIPPQPYSQTSAGIYYSAACFATGLYTDPVFGGCDNASDPSSYLCAYGTGDGCRLCPSNALCPGGKRLRPRQGGWLASESSDTITACGPPNPERCVLGEPCCCLSPPVVHDTPSPLQVHRLGSRVGVNQVCPRVSQRQLRV